MHWFSTIGKLSLVFWLLEIQSFSAVLSSEDDRDQLFLLQYFKTLLVNLNVCEVTANNFSVVL